MHTPVLLKQTIAGLNIKPNGKYIDCTYGEGGHTGEILNNGGIVLAIEWDNTKKIALKNKNLTVVFDNFANIENIAKINNFLPVDGVLFDLGLSMEQIKNGKRGFSFKNDTEVLDMRINENIDKTAADLINSLSKTELYEIFAKNSEEINSMAISDAIYRTRLVKKIKTVADLKEILPKNESTIKRIFQALRIEVNNEFNNLKKGLYDSLKIIKKDGVIAVITFHSVEDRIVKNFILNNNLRSETKKPIIARNNNSFEKTAKLRLIKLC